MNTERVVFSGSQEWFDAEAQVPLISGYCLSALLASPGALRHIQLSILVTRLWSLPFLFFFSKTTPLLFSTPLELSFADSIAWGHNSAPNSGRALNPRTPPTFTSTHHHHFPQTPTNLFTKQLQSPPLLFPISLIWYQLCSLHFPFSVHTKICSRTKEKKKNNQQASLIMLPLPHFYPSWRSILQQGTLTMKCLQRKLSCWRVEVRYNSHVLKTCRIAGPKRFPLGWLQMSRCVTEYPSQFLSHSLKKKEKIKGGR